MTDQTLLKVQKLLEGQIDFAGQKKTEILTTSMLVGTALMAFVVGAIQQDIHLTLWLGLGGTALTFLVVVPPWPMYNEDPESWLPEGSGIAGAGIEVDGKRVN